MVVFVKPAIPLGALKEATPATPSTNPGVYGLPVKFDTIDVSGIQTRIVCDTRSVKKTAPLAFDARAVTFASLADVPMPFAYPVLPATPSNVVTLQPGAGLAVGVDTIDNVGVVEDEYDEVGENDGVADVVTVGEFTDVGDKDSIGQLIVLIKPVFPSHT